MADDEGEEASFQDRQLRATIEGVEVARGALRVAWVSAIVNALVVATALFSPLYQERQSERRERATNQAINDQILNIGLTTTYFVRDGIRNLGLDRDAEIGELKAQQEPLGNLKTVRWNGYQKSLSEYTIKKVSDLAARMTDLDKRAPFRKDTAAFMSSYNSTIEYFLASVQHHKDIEKSLAEYEKCLADKKCLMVDTNFSQAALADLRRSVLYNLDLQRRDHVIDTIQPVPWNWKEHIEYKARQ